MNYLQLNVIYGKKLKGMRSDEKRKTFSPSVTNLCLSLWKERGPLKLTKISQV